MKIRRWTSCRSFIYQNAESEY